MTLDVLSLATHDVHVKQAYDLVVREAELLDHWRLDEWLDMFAEEVEYWVPIDASRDDPTDGLNIVLDDRARLMDRVSRIQSGNAHVFQPRVDTSRMLGNWQIERSTRSTESLLIVTSRFVLIAVHPDTGKRAVYAGRYRHELLTGGAQLLIRSKRVDLAGSRAPMAALPVIL